MAAVYDLITEFGASGADDFSATPAWVVAVVRFKYRSTYDRAIDSASYTIGQDGNLKAEYNANRSIFKDDGHAVAEREVLVMSNEVFQLSTNSDKGSHVTSLQARLLPLMHYTAEIGAGDWVMAWMVNSQAQRNDLIQRIKSKKPCNHFDDGLKFMGRVQTIRDNFTRDSGSGRLQRLYSLTANGFTEFDSEILYFPQLEQSDGLGSWVKRLGVFLNTVVGSGTGNHDAGALDINLILPELLEKLLGKGLPPSTRYNKSGVDATPNPETPAAYVVPDTIGALLGNSGNSSTQTLHYGDLFEAILGVQHYPVNNADARTQADWKALIPQIADSSTRYYKTGSPLVGEFTAAPPKFDFTPVWQLLGSYLNPGVNEMYVTLRVSPTPGSDDKPCIVPTFVVRQLPFTTPQYEPELPDFTSYFELPRWKIPHALLVSGDVGTSDGLRFNIVQVDGIEPNQPLSVAGFARNPPVRDDLDIKRSGLRPYVRTVNCSFKDAKGIEPRKWTSFVADFTMGQQLTYTGTLVLMGVQAPIAVGDNCEFNGVLYHIESVQHTCGIDTEGHRFFQTTLSLSHGMAIESAYQAGVSKVEIASDAMYPGIVIDDTDMPSIAEET